MTGLRVRSSRGAPAPPTEAFWLRDGARGPEPFTRALADPPAVRGERIRERDGVAYRFWDPTRSKLAAALLCGLEGQLPSEGARWLYLGAASGTTASHVADLVGPAGMVYAVEPSLRPFRALLALSERYPNLAPIRGDARHPEQYEGSVPPVDGIYADIAQPDQPEILSENLRWFLRPGGRLLFVVKTASLGRDRSSSRLLDEALARLPPDLPIGPPCSLEPFHRRHYLVAGGEDRATRSRSAVPPRRPFRRPGSRARGRS